MYFMIFNAMSDQSQSGITSHCRYGLLYFIITLK